jgi:hypothetical protein
MRPVQIDPDTCGCTECLIGLYVPLGQATTEQIKAMMRGELSNATSEVFTLTTVTPDILSGSSDTTFTVRAEYCEREWTWTIPQYQIL